MPHGGDSNDLLIRILPWFLSCATGNSCRSHMAEGNPSGGVKGQFRVAQCRQQTAGHGHHPLAIKALAEIGSLDISGHTSKHMNDFLTQSSRWRTDINRVRKRGASLSPGSRVR
jgi:protein-tyrosine-phosphatase